MKNHRPLRVCFLIGKYPPQFGGHGIQTRRTIPFLRSRGFEASVLAYRIDQPLLDPPTGGQETVHRTLDPGSGRMATIHRVWQFRRHLRDNRDRYDIVHSAFLGWEFLLNIPYFKALGLPLVFEMLLLGGDDPLTLSREWLGGTKLRLLRGVDAWVGIAGAFLPRLRATGIPEERFRLIYCGVDVDSYRPASEENKRALRASLGLPAGARIAVSVGSVIPRKGMDRVVKAWARLSPVPGRDLLIIAGPASATDGLAVRDLGYVEDLRRLAEAPGVAGTVRFIGRVDRVQDYLAAADLFVFLSRQEGLGTVILEAQACGLPCVVSPLDGIASEIVAEGKTGVIVRNPDDAAAAAAVLESLLSDGTRLQAMGGEARRQAVARFSFETRAAALETLYRETLGTRPARR